MNCYLGEAGGQSLASRFYILEKFQSLHLFEALVSAVKEIEHAKAAKALWVRLHNLFIF